MIFCPKCNRDFNGASNECGVGRGEIGGSCPMSRHSKYRVDVFLIPAILVLVITVIALMVAFDRCGPWQKATIAENQGSRRFPLRFGCAVILEDGRIKLF